MTSNGEAKVPNLRETRKEMAASRRRHPAGKALPAKAPVKKAPAKAAAKKAVDKTATPKLRWKLLAERTPGNFAVPQEGSCNGHTWQILQADSGWRVVHRDPSGKETTLTEKPVGYGAAYRLCVDAAKAVAA